MSPLAHNYINTTSPEYTKTGGSHTTWYVYEGLCWSWVEVWVIY